MLSPGTFHLDQVPWGRGEQGLDHTRIFISNFCCAPQPCSIISAPSHCLPFHIQLVLGALKQYPLLRMLGSCYLIDRVMKTVWWWPGGGEPPLCTPRVLCTVPFIPPSLSTLLVCSSVLPTRLRVPWEQEPSFMLSPVSGQHRIRLAKQFVLNN